MANNLEKITEDYSPETYYDDYDYSNGLEYAVNQSSPNVFLDPHIRMFTKGIKDKRRKREIEKDIERLYSKYAYDIRKGNPVVSRAELLEQAWNIAGQEPLEGKEPIHVLNQQLYSNPGRQYQYVNGIVGDKKKSSEIKTELGKAGKYAIKEGWPVLGAGASWMLANNFYKKNIAYDLKNKKGIFKKRKKSGIGGAIISGGTQAGKYAFRGATRPIWNLVKTPVAYGIGAYAVYKVISYLLKRKKEKKLEKEEIERLENIRHNMLAERQMFYTPSSEMMQSQ